MSNGFTVAAVAQRMQKIELSMWKNYTALATLAFVRGTKRSVLQTKVFGQEKPSATFRQACNIAAKLFANGMGETHKSEVAQMGIDDAEAFIVACLDAHMTALGVSGKNAYLEVADYASKEALEAARALAKEDEAADEAANPAAPADAPEAPAENTAVSEPVTGVDAVVKVAETFSDAELADLMARLNAIAIARAETAALIEAQEQRKAA